MDRRGVRRSRRVGCNTEVKDWIISCGGVRFNCHFGYAFSDEEIARVRGWASYLQDKMAFLKWSKTGEVIFVNL